MTRSLEHNYTSAIPGTILDTCEVRWFARGPMPGGMVSWFTAGGRFGVGEQRTDLYQRRPGTTVGVKRRSGTTLEVKVLQSRGPDISMPDGPGGCCEAWRKWQPRSGAALSSGTVSWIAVAKSIVTRSFVLPGDGGMAAPVSEPDRRLPGCDVELAAVTVGGTRAWTYAFEAFGPAQHRLTALRIAAEAVARTTPYPPGFWARLDCNAGYPAWLDVLQPHEAVAAG